MSAFLIVVGSFALGYAAGPPIRPRCIFAILGAAALTMGLVAYGVHL
jgi:hypothetical protein